MDNTTAEIRIKNIANKSPRMGIFPFLPFFFPLNESIYMYKNRSRKRKREEAKDSQIRAIRN